MEDALDHFIKKYFKYYSKSDMDSVKSELLALCKNIVLFMTEQTLLNINNVYTKPVGINGITANASFNNLVSNQEQLPVLANPDGTYGPEGPDDSQSVQSIQSSKSTIITGSIQSNVSNNIDITNFPNLSKVFKFGDKQQNCSQGIKMTEKKRGRKRIKPDRRLMTKFVCKGLKPDGNPCVKSFYEDNYNGYCHSHKDQYENDTHEMLEIHIDNSSDITEVSKELSMKHKCNCKDCKGNVGYKSIFDNYYCEIHVKYYLDYDLNMAHQEFISKKYNF